MKRMGFKATFVDISAKLGQKNLLRMVTWWMVTFQAGSFDHGTRAPAEKDTKKVILRMDKSLLILSTFTQQ